MAQETKRRSKSRKSAKAEETNKRKSEIFRITGRVINGETNESVVGLLITAFDEDRRPEQLLGQATTDKDGHYEITYTADQFRGAEEKTADLIVRVFDEKRAERGASAIYHNAPREVMINVFVTNRGLSEYERLGEYLRRATQLAKETAIPAEAFYAWFRQGLPTNINLLSTLDTNVLIAALKAATKLNIVPARLARSHEEIVEELKAYQRVYKLSSTGEEAACLLKRGYRSALDIVNEPRAGFIEKLVPIIGAAKAAKIYALAEAEVASSSAKSD